MSIICLACVDMSKSDACVVHVIDLANAFTQLGEQCSIHIFSAEKSVITQNNLVVERLPKVRTWPLVFLLENVFIASRIIFGRYSDCDLIYIRMSPSLILSIIVLKYLRHKVIFLEVNGISEDEILIEGRDWYRSCWCWVAKFSDRLACNLADKIIAVTSGIKEYIQGAYNIPLQKIQVIPNGVDTNAFRKNISRAQEIRSKYNISQGCMVFGFIGNFAGWQGVDLAIMAFSKLARRYSDVFLMLVGDGRDGAYYQKLAKTSEAHERIIFAGRVHKDDAPDFISSFDVGVTFKKPIRSGYSALKLYSYLSCGVPVLGTDVRGYEILNDKKCGLLCKNDVDDIASRMEEVYMMKKANLLGIYSISAREVAVKYFDWTNIARNILRE